MKRLLVVAAFVLLAVPASAARLPILASHDWWPVFSPDSKYVAFTRVDGQGRIFSLEVVPARGGKVVQLARAGSQLLPSWSPDATHLAYQSGGHVYTVARNGTGKTLVATGGFPDWSPDGPIAYVRGGTLRVGTEALATQVIWKPDWSPDGKEIAFARSDGIHVVSSGGVERQVAKTAGEPSAPLWSPDGSSIAYTVGPRIYVVAATGGAPRLLAGPYASLGPLAWAPAGDMVAYTADGAVRTTYLTPRHTLVLVKGAEVGTSFAPGDPQGRILAYSAPRAGCPGHSGIRLYDSAMLTGTCTIAGTAGADVIEGTQSWGDVILAGAGNDRIHAGDRHTDRIVCGPGRDTVWADRLDRLTGCEIVHR